MDISSLKVARAYLAALDLEQFARVVKLNLDDAKKFHGDRAFISSVYDEARSNGLRMSLDEFKKNLVAAHRKGFLRITRADLVGAMPADLVARSETEYMGATFHFVVVE